MNKKLKITINAPMVLGFVFICFIATLLDVLSNGSITEKFFMTYHSSFKDIMTYVRFFTHVFGHNGWGHFIGNAAYILLLGPLLEEKYGAKTILELIGLTALVTGLVHFFFFPSVGLCGASGVVFAFIILSSFTGFREKEIPLTFILVVAIFIGQQVYQGITANDNVSYISHIIGGLIGGVVGFVLNRKHRKK